MRSLFLRILLWFWLAMGLIAVAFALIFLQTDPSWRYERRAYVIGLALRAHGARVVERLERDGPGSAVEPMRAFEERTEYHTFLFRDGSPAVTTGVPSGEVLAVVAEATARGEPVVRQGETLDHFAEPIGGTGPAAYVMAAEYPHPTRLERYLGLDTAWLRLLVALLVASAVGWFVARQIAGPIRRLRTAARRLESGDLTARVGSTLGGRRDELAALAGDFDRMAERIESLVESERRLLRDVSHELRSPLARMRVALQLARDRAGPDAAEPLDRLEKDAERLSELVGQVLAVTRLEADPSSLHAEPVAFGDLVREVCDDADFEARGRNRRVALAATAAVEVTGAEEVLRRAVENVVRNGVRFTAEETTVEVTLERTDGPDGPRARVRVRDRGPGVPEEALREIFQPFRRVDDARGRGDGGTGLGLAITERAVRLHGGTVAAANAPDGGLVVEIELPAKS